MPNKLVSRITKAVVNALNLNGTVSYKRPDGSVWMSVRNVAGEDSAEIVIDGPIGASWWDSSGITSKAFTNELDRIPKGRKVNVKINSEGGSVGDALGCYNAMQERADDVTCTVTGYALSSASILALGGSRTIAPRSSILMIHEPWSYTTGDKADHERAAAMLDKHGDTLAAIYSKKTGKSADEMREAMKKETWFTGEEAAAFGLAELPEEDDEDEEETEKEGDKAKSFAALLPRYRNVPANILNQFSAGSGGKAGNAASKPATATTDPVVTTTEKTDMSEKNAAATTANDKTAAATPANELADIRAQLLRERTVRIEARIDNFIGEGRVTNDERKDAVTRAMADEGYLDVIGKRPRFNAGAAALGGGHGIEVIGDTFTRIRNEKTPALRHEVRRNAWSELYAHAQAMDARGSRFQPGMSLTSNLPVNANSTASALIVDFLADQAIISLVNTLPPLRVFTLDFAPNAVAPLNTVQVRLVSQGGGTTQKATRANVNATGSITDYEANADHTMAAVGVTLSEYSKGTNLTAQELNSGMRIEALAGRAILELGSDIITDTLAVFNTSTFTGGAANGTVQAHYGTFGWNVSGGTDMSTLRAALGKSPVKNAILDPVLFSKLAGININNGINPLSLLNGGNQSLITNQYGWSNVAETSAWAGAQGLPNTTGSIIGIGCNPQAVACAARLPLLPPEGIPGNTIAATTVTIPGMDLGIAVYHWFSLGKRTTYVSFGLIYGASAGDLTAACVLKSLGA